VEQPTEIQTKWKQTEMSSTL